MLFTSLSLKATDEVNVYLEGVYAHGLGSFDAFNLPAPAIPAESPISPDNDHPKSDYDYSNIAQYSDLNYVQVEATLGANYAYEAGRSVYGSISLMDLQDDAAYVYGDLSGTMIMYATGLRIDF